MNDILVYNTSVNCFMIFHLASFLDTNRKTLFAGERGRNLLDGGAAFYDTYETKDGQHMAVGSLEPKFYADLVKGEIC